MRSNNRMMRYGVVAGIVGVLAALFAWQQLGSDEESLGLIDLQRARVGEPAPDFVLTIVDDPRQQVRLSDFRGQPVVLNFWASWCTPCIREMPLLQEAFQEHDRDVMVLGVNFKEEPARAQGFAAEMGVTFPLVTDRTGAVTERYGLRGIPATFFIDSQGVVRAITFGPVFDELLPQGIAEAEAAPAVDTSSGGGVVASEETGETGDVIVVNTTRADVTIVLNGEPLGTLAPGEDLVVGRYSAGTTFGRVIAKNAAGDNIYKPWVTWPFLVANDFRLEVVDQSGG